ncbi:MAG: hypothetical protein ABW173_08260 [Sphingomonas sp.]
MRRGLMGCALALALLAGCSRSNDTPAADETVVQNIAEPLPPIEDTPPPEPAPPPPPVEIDRNVAEALPAEEPPSVDEQMREDAEAAGMTARSASPDVATDPSADPIGALMNGLDNGGQ